MFTLGIYKTLAAAEAAYKLWLDVYTDEQLDIVFDGSSYLLQVKCDDPR